MRLQPDLPEAHQALGEIYWKSTAISGGSDYSDALREFEIALRGLPNDPDIFAALGRIQRHQGKWSEAIASLQKAAALDPKTADRWHRLFSTCESTRDYAAASAALERAIALSPNTWSFERDRGFLNLFWKGDRNGLERLRTPTEDPEVEKPFSSQKNAAQI